MSKPQKLPPEDEVLRRMLNTPPTPHKARKPAPALKRATVRKVSEPK